MDSQALIKVLTEVSEKSQTLSPASKEISAWSSSNGKSSSNLVFLTNSKKQTVWRTSLSSTYKRKARPTEERDNSKKHYVVDKALTRQKPCVKTTEFTSSQKYFAEEGTQMKTYNEDKEDVRKKTPDLIELIQKRPKTPWGVVTNHRKRNRLERYAKFNCFYKHERSIVENSKKHNNLTAMSVEELVKSHKMRLRTREFQRNTNREHIPHLYDLNRTTNRVSILAKAISK